MASVRGTRHTWAHMPGGRIYLGYGRRPGLVKFTWASVPTPIGNASFSIATTFSLWVFTGPRFGICLANPHFVYKDLLGRPTERHFLFEADNARKNFHLGVSKEGLRNSAKRRGRPLARTTSPACGSERCVALAHSWQFTLLCSSAA